MKTIKCYVCECGEDFYEDDTECCNCGTLVDQSKFVNEPLIEITHQGECVVTEDELVGLNNE